MGLTRSGQSLRALWTERRRVCLFQRMTQSFRVPAFRVFAALAVFTLASAAPALARARIHVDLDAQRMTVTRDSGETVVWKISSGRSGYETPSGHYSVYRMEADHFSDEYDQAPMPYAMFFSPRGLAIHGTYEKGLGRPRSHGCVRLAIANARQLYEWVEKEGASVDISGEAGGYGGGRDVRVSGDGFVALDDGAPRRAARHERSHRRAPPPESEAFDRYYGY
jgi:hypothetical protein